MKILIAEDSDEKIDDLISFFECSIAFNYELDICHSFKDTINKIETKKYDVVLLDMTMPTSNNGLKNKRIKNRSLAGKDVLDTLSYNEVELPQFIIFSQFGEFGRHSELVSLREIYQDLYEEYSDIVVGYVKYESNSEVWKRDLSVLLNGI